MVQPDYFTNYLDILAVVLKRSGHRERRAADDCGCTPKNECLLGKRIKEKNLLFKIENYAQRSLIRNA